MLKQSCDRSATSRRLCRDLSASTKTWLRLIWSQWGPRSADFSATSPGPIGDLVATSAIGGNCQSRRGRKAVATYVWPGLKRYFSHIATWKQEITNLWNRSGETGNRTLQAKSLTTTPPLLLNMYIVKRSSHDLYCFYAPNSEACVPCTSASRSRYQQNSSFCNIEFLFATGYITQQQ